MTLPERLLWHAVSGRQLGPRFRRQVPLGPYVVDFYCAQAKLVVEVDGEVHDNREARDAERTAWLESQGYRVVRFRAIDVLSHLDDVLAGLLLELPPPALDGPPPPRGGRDLAH